MSARNFHSISMAAGVAAAALGCYMVSLRVAAERTTLEQVETRIVLAQRDIRLLQTEVGTRGRLAQLEKWNVKVLALSAPDANQFLQGSFQLATLVRPRDRIVDPSAPVVLASAPKPERRAIPEQSDSANARPGMAPADMMHVASYKAPVRVVERQAPLAKPVVKVAASTPSLVKPASAKPASVKMASAKPPVVKVASAKVPATKLPSTKASSAKTSDSRTVKSPTLPVAKVAATKPKPPTKPASSSSAPAGKGNKDGKVKQ
jgi:hypothetical protein